LEIGIWILFVICYLELGFFMINYCAIFVMKHTVVQQSSISHQRILEIGVAVSAKIDGNGIQICDSP
jgi:hypothetical protein